jgi:dTDP-glucose 4,6-dehydratase
MKTIMITGATGFIGSHLTEQCIELGYKVKAFDRYNSNNHWGWLEDSKHTGDFEVILGDVRDYDSVSKAMQGCDSVFHLSALTGIPYSYVSPLAYIRTNVEGAYNVLEAAKNKKLDHILITSTSETYGTAQYVPIDECHPLVGQSPYSATKIAADQLAISYYRSFGLPVTIARPFNTYGPRQSARAVIPTIVTQLLSKQRDVRLGSLEPTRDLNYVSDICNGLIALAECDEAIGREVNIGSGTEISIDKLANLIIDIMGVDARVVSDEHRVRPENSEVERLVCDSEILRQLTGWKPEITINEGLVKTIEWFEDENNLQKYKSEIYNI